MKKSLLFIALMLNVMSAYSDDIIASDAYSACKGLMEKDSCQMHNKENHIISGICSMKMGGDGNLNTYCRADKDTAQNHDASNSSVSNGNEKHRRKHKS